MSRRSISVFNMSFLDLMTNFLGAVIILFLLAMVDQGGQKSAFSAPAFRGSVTFDSTQNMIIGDVERVFKNVKKNDTILVVVSGFGPMPGAGNTASDGGGTVFVKCSRDHFDNPACPPPCPPPGQCAIVASYSNDPCNDRGTPNLPTDDTYSTKITVKKAGECGTSWKDNLGNSGQYEVAKNYGPFLIGDGKKTIEVNDAGSGKMFKLEIAPPTPCSDKTTAPPIAGKVPPIEPGRVNFVATWGTATNKVNLYVRRQGGAWIPKLGNADGNWTDYAVRKKGKLLKEQIGEVFYQDKPSPGVYEIWIQNWDSGTPAREVNFWVSSQLSPETNLSDRATIPYSKTSPKDGGGKKVAVIEITSAGKIILRAH